MRWGVEISNTELDKQNLKDLLKALGFQLIEDSICLIFTGNKLDSLHTVSEVIDEAKRVRKAITGPANIDPLFQLGYIIDYSNKPPKRHGVLETEPGIYSLKGGNASLTILPPKALSYDELQRWQEASKHEEYCHKLEQQLSKLIPAFRSEIASKVLELLAVEKPTGETLYKVYELMEGQFNDRKSFHSHFGITEDDFNSFKDVVHNPDVSQDWARHARSRKLNSNRPMSKKEAESFIQILADKWLEYVRSSL